VPTTPEFIADIRAHIAATLADDEAATQALIFSI
jgi:hypothetical protein